MLLKVRASTLLAYAIAHAASVCAAGHAYFVTPVPSGTTGDYSNSTVYYANNPVALIWEDHVGFSAYDVLVWQEASGIWFKAATNLKPSPEAPNQTFTWTATLSNFTGQKNDGKTNATPDILYFEIQDPKNTTRHFESHYFKVENEPSSSTSPSPTSSSSPTSPASSSTRSTATPSSQPTDSNTPSTEKAQTSGGLSDGAKAGLGVGLGVGIPILAGLAYIAFLLRQRQDQNKNQDQRQDSMRIGITQYPESGLSAAPGGTQSGQHTAGGGSWKTRSLWSPKQQHQQHQQQAPVELSPHDGPRELPDGHRSLYELPE